MLGLRPTADAEYADITGADEIIVTSDGARLTVERVLDLEKWITETIHVAPENHPHPSPHGDLAVIHAKRISYR